MAQDILNLNGTDYELGAKASSVSYDNTNSGMNATNAQAAIDELKASVGSSTPYVGKTIAVIGDSFTAMGAGSTGWFDVMCRALGATMQSNEADSGGAWHGNDGVSAYQQAQDLVTHVGNNHPDYILIVMGVNDINNDSDFYRFKDPDGVDLGNIVYTNQHDGNELSQFDLTTSPYSFTAGVQATLTYLKKHFPNAIIKIGWTPSGMQFMANGFRYPGENKDPWQIFHSYVQRLKDLADMYGVDYINTLHCGISWWVTEDFEEYMVDNNNYHPNEAARQRIGEYMARLMLSNL